MRKKTIILAVSGLLLVSIAALAGSILWKQKNANVLIEQQNFVASRLLESGKYSAAEAVAMESEQIKTNAVSRELIVLSKGFQINCDAVLTLAEGYLTQQEDNCIDSVKKICETYLAERENLVQDDIYEYEEQCEALTEEVRRDCLGVLLEVEKKINVKKGSDSLRILAEAYYEDADSYYENAFYVKQIPDNADDTLFGKKVKAVYALQNGNLENGMEDAQKLLRESDTFEHRVIVANYVAQNGKYLFSQEMMGKEEEEIAENSAQRAINYIETTTPIYQRDTSAYQMELSYLYYKADKKEKAQKILVDLVKKETSIQEPVSILIMDFIRAYSQTGENSYVEMISGGESTTGIWKKIKQLMGFLESNYYDTDNFYGFWLETLDDVFNGLIIRQIDTTQYPTVAVTVNVAKEIERKLTKSDFAVKDMGIAQNDFDVVSLQDEEQAMENLSVELVVDHSGSMDGTPLEDTKKAVANFVKNAGDGIRIGLVKFDDRAEVVAQIMDSRNVILQGINTIISGGGTSIYSGLELAGNELANEDGRRIIILLSDGEDGNTGQIDQILNQLRKRNIVVYTIGFGGVDTQYLSYIANACNGKFIQAESSDMLGEIYAEIGQFMANDYLITFQAEEEIERYDRFLRIENEQDDAFAEQDYYIGVTAKAIQLEEKQPPLSDYFQEIGGSRMDVSVQP